ncbi:ATP-grasp domain-containing protein [Actinoplanes sp. NPDC051859]|uniref:ATP-grasp domain-containing protein n=1 Tax=Actinoplanes sp. NPDC051859 TaxID=3363909 RepID=UPI00379EF217
MLLLVPGDPLRPRRPDEHFAAEAAAARVRGIDVALVDHDALTRGGPADAAVARVPAGSGPASYRGWMLRTEQYAAMATALAAREVELRTSPEQYQRGHELPGWYAALVGHTPETAWTLDDTRGAFEQACAVLGGGPAVLRDFTKSMKHYWNEAAYVPDVADGGAAWRVASRFRELRDDEFTGGFVLRRFETFTGAEARTWWVNGNCRLVTAHPDTAADAPAADVDVASVAPSIAQLGLPFVTADLVRHADGRWRVVELGDGQVSDRPASTPAEEFIAAIT